MKCTACNKDLNRKEVVYSEDKKAYCPNPFQCNENHPNSVPNILSRGAAVKLFTADELEDNIFERLNISEEMKDRIMRVATKPQSIRLSKYDIAYYLLALQERMEFSSISEAVRYCVNLAMELRPLSDIPLAPKKHESKPIPKDAVEAEPASVEEVQVKAAQTIAQSSGIKFVVPDIPKSINVDWSTVKRDPEQDEINEEEEEELTF